MDLALRIFLILSTCVYFAILLSMLKKGKFGLKYALIWLFMGLAMIVFIIWPNAVYAASRLIGVSNPVNAVFLVFALFSVIMLISVTSVISKLMEKNLRLSQSLALLEERVRRLEEERKD